MKKLKSTRGITLIALVVTIVVLLILAAVSISMLGGENGIITQAQNAKEETIIGEEKEKIQLSAVAAAGKDNWGEITEGNLKTELDINIGDGKYTLIENDNKFKITYNDTKRSYELDKNGKVTYIEKSDNEENILKTINEIHAGEKIYYNTGNTNIGDNGIIECIVLYDKEYNDTHNTNYGIQIITSDIVEKITIGLGDPTIIDGETDLEKVKESYNNAIITLNEGANKYLNGTYAIDARCVGSIPDNKNYDTGYFNSTYSYMNNYNGMFKNQDKNYENDYNQMDNLGIKATSDSYWLASRYIYDSAWSANFDMRTIDAEGELRDFYVFLCEINIDNTMSNRGRDSGLRPVFTLHPDLEIISGDGIETPYTLKQP